MSNPDDERRRAYTAMLFPPVTAQDAVDMIRYQRELVAALETEREISSLSSRALDEHYDGKYLGPVPAKTTVEVGPNGLLRFSFPIYPQDYEEEPSDAR